MYIFFIYNNDDFIYKVDIFINNYIYILNYLCVSFLCI